MFFVPGRQAAWWGWPILLQKENVSWSELGGVEEIIFKYSFELESHFVFLCFPCAIVFSHHNSFIAGRYVNERSWKASFSCSHLSSVCKSPSGLIAICSTAVEQRWFSQIYLWSSIYERSSHLLGINLADLSLSAPKATHWSFFLAFSQLPLHNV